MTEQEPCFIAETDLTKRELKRLNYLKQILTNLNIQRTLHVREGVCQAWTDGTDYICLNRQTLNLPFETFRVYAFLNIMHEFSHDPTALAEYKPLDHGEPYFRRFHDNCFQYAKPFFDRR